MRGSGRGGIGRDEACALALQSLREAGVACDAAYEQALRDHFRRLPSRYAADVDSAEDVATHQKLLEQVRQDASRVSLSVRVVGFCRAPTSLSAAAGTSQSSADGGVGSRGHSRTVGGPAGAKRPPTFGSSLNLLALDDASPRAGAALSSLQPAQAPLVFHELAVAAGNRPRLLSHLTAIFGELGLNIDEAHVFCTDDGLALDVFVVEGWHTEDALSLQETLSAKLQVLGGGTAGKLAPTLMAAESGAQRVPSESGGGAGDWEIDPNRLQFLENVASGSFGDLFRGMYNGQEVAIKVLRLAQHNDQAHLIREFMQELSVLRKVRHKNVVQLIGASTTPPKLCIVTEFMRRGSLLDFLHRHHPLKLSLIVKLATDVARGMDYLHKSNIIHRDLKGANLLMNEHDDCKVADFGVARVMDPTACMTAETGTYRWMAPEVVSHQPYDHKCDVFSFGVLLWELVTGGAVPYAGFTPLQAAVGVVQKGLRPSIPEGAHPALVQLMHLCWDAKPQNRPDFSQIVTLLASVSPDVSPQSSSAVSAPSSSQPAKTMSDEKEKEKGGFFARMRRHL